MGWADPLGVFTPSGFSQAGTDARISPHAAPVAFASLQRSIAAPPHRPGEPFGPRASDDASFPGLLCPTTHAGRGTRIRRVSNPAACRVRGLATSFATSTPDPPRNLADPRASTGFDLRGVLLEPVRSALADRCRPAVLRVGSPRPLRCVRTRSASRPCSRRRARAAARPFRAAGRRCLLGLSPSRAFSPSVLASALVAPAPSARIGRD